MAKGAAPWVAEVAGGLAVVGVAAWPAASSAVAHRRGPLPPRRYPVPARAAVLAVTHRQ
jgi:hypothetical protein